MEMTRTFNRNPTARSGNPGLRKFRAMNVNRTA